MPTKRLIRILTILAVLLAPLGMLGGLAAPATAQVGGLPGHHADAPAEMAHCAEPGEGESDEPPPPRHDCMMACAAIPPLASGIDAPPAPSSAGPVPLSTFRHGLKPEAATPPPRFP